MIYFLEFGSEPNKLEVIAYLKALTPYIKNKAICKEVGEKILKLFNKESGTSFLSKLSKDLVSLSIYIENPNSIISCSLK